MGYQVELAVLQLLRTQAMVLVRLLVEIITVTLEEAGEQEALMHTISQCVEDQVGLLVMQIISMGVQV
jgi:hypothetical protein